jgi:hypothetical protein
MNNNVNLTLLQPKNPIMSPLVSNKQEHKMENHKIQNHKIKKIQFESTWQKSHKKKKIQKKNGFIFDI